MNLLGILGKFALREKFVVVVSMVIITSMLIISGYVIKRQNEIFKIELEKRAKALVANLAYNAEYGVILESQEELENLIAGVIRSDDVIYAVIAAGDNRILAELGKNLSVNAKLIKNHIENNQTEDKFSVFHYIAGDETEFIELRYPVETIRKLVSRENLGVVGSSGNDLYETEVIGEARVGLTMENLHKEINKSQTAALLLTFVVVISAIIIMTAFVRIITRPIESLVEITDQISKGDLSKAVEIERSDEIGLLAKSFNRMIESLKKSQQEIEEYNRTLEEKIIERTKELEDAQTQLIQTEKMAAIGQLAAGVAHELNNPLGGILGYAQFNIEKIENKSAENITDKDLDSYRRYLKDIEHQTRRCKAIVQNLLKFSRTSQTIDFSDTDVNAVIEDTLTFLEHQLMINRLTLKKNLDHKIPVIQGNPSQLQQVFTNILINAMHASQPETEITVSTKFSPPLGEYAGAIEITLTDQGKGISKGNLKKIFEPFFTTKDGSKIFFKFPLLIPLPWSEI